MKFPPARFSCSLGRALPAVVSTAVSAAVFAVAIFPAHAKEDADANGPVSYYKKVRPIFQAQCQGCHQPAKAKGGYVMTDFAKLLAGGEEAATEGAAIVAGKPEESYLVKQVTPVNGEAEMPPKKKPLHEVEIALIRRWIAEGAKDDTPENAKQRFDAEHPPVYSQPPVITSLNFSPDGSLLSVAGFHEVVLWKGDGGEQVARLVGLSERVQSLQFSPDGKKLAVAGGRPAQMGEIQIWDVEKRKLLLSAPQGFDTVYGVSWSPDGKTVAFGCADKAVRAIDAETGRQVLQQASHDDWVLGTVFTHDGSKLVSVGRDMTAKLTEVATQRFIDNLSSITPGALRGGLQTVDRHPERNEFLVGGADGSPQAYRIERKVQRRIGDNALLIRRWPQMEGRIYSVAFAPDGKSFAAGSSLDGRGEVSFFNYDFDTAMPADIVAIEGKAAQQRTDADKAKLEAHYTSETKRLAGAKTEGGVYAVSYNPDGSLLAAAGEDGRVRLIDPKDGRVVKEFVPVTVSATAAKD